MSLQRSFGPWSIADRTLGRDGPGVAKAAPGPFCVWTGYLSFHYMIKHTTRTNDKTAPLTKSPQAVTRACKLLAPGGLTPPS